MNQDRVKIVITWIVVIFAIFNDQLAYGQVGATARFVHSIEDIYTKVAPQSLNENEKNQGFALAVDYRNRLKSYRLEFGPELSLQMVNIKSLPFDTIGLDNGRLIRQNAIGLRFPVTAYPLDWETCNCPTFNKKGLWFKQGFFTQISPGYELRIPQWELENTDAKIQHFLSLGIQLGIDFRIAKQIVISPVVGVRHLFGLNESKSFLSSPNQIELGIRIGQWKKIERI